MSDIEVRVKKIIAEQLGVEESQVTNEKAFVADLGADSLDTVELVMALEDEFGIEIPGYFKWSLVQYVYKQWAGLYENKGRYVYVNRGFGFHAYSGRVGIMPEITVIELKKGNKLV